MNKDEFSIHLLKPKFQKNEDCQKTSQKKMNGAFFDFYLLKCNGILSLIIWISIAIVLIMLFKIKIYAVSIFIVIYFIWRYFAIRKIFMRDIQK